MNRFIQFLSIAILISLFFFSACTPTFIQNEKEEFKSHFPNEDYFNQRNYPEEDFDHKHFFQQMEDAKTIAATKSLIGTWEDQGPGNIGARINKIAINPSDENEIYLAFARGGLFKTTDGGQNWESKFDLFTYLSVSHIEIDPNNPEILYIGTGDENISHYPGIGNGVYKSINGGDSWTNIGLSEGRIISNIHIDRQNSELIYASAMGLPFNKNNDRGLYKSIDGGSNWDQVLFLNDSTGVIDFVVAPNNPDIIYAAGWTRIRNNSESRISGIENKIHKSTDGGMTWIEMENGLPFGPSMVRIGLEMFDEEGDIVFASVSQNIPSDSCEGGGANFYGLYKTIDAGNDWQELQTFGDNGIPCDIQGGFAWYFGKLAVNPNDQNDISIPGVHYYRTRDNGQNWIELDENDDFWVHVDFHDVVYYDDNIYVATDGGAYKYNDLTGWSDIENIHTNQVYRVAFNPHNPDRYYAGLQDNGTVGGSAADPNSYDRLFGGDGFQTVFHPNEPNQVYAETQNGTIWKSTDGEFGNFNRFTDGLQGNANWNMPYLGNSVYLLAGRNRIYRSLHEIEEWTPISDVLVDTLNSGNHFEHNITALSQSKLDLNVIYAGTSDGWVWNTQDFDENYEKIIDGLPRRWVSAIVASETEVGRVFMSMTGYKSSDFSPHIYRSENYGQDWVNISGDLPNIAINDILVPKGFDDQVIFIANEAGVYFSKNAGENWERLGENFPYIQTLDMVINPVLNQLVAGTYGRGIQSFDLDQIDLDLVANEEVEPNSSFSIYPNVSSDIVQIEIDHSYLKDAKLVISNQAGQLIKSFNRIPKEISISDLNAGVYYCRIQAEKFVETKRFIKI